MGKFLVTLEDSVRTSDSNGTQDVKNFFYFDNYRLDAAENGILCKNTDHVHESFFPIKNIRGIVWIPNKKNENDY